MAPEGPLGFPRLMNIGPFVEEENAEELFLDITTRAHSYRHYEPEEFIRLIESGYDQEELRTELKVIEAGRFYDMLKSTHNFWWRLDEDEMEDFYNVNPDLVKWVEVYARLEDQSAPSSNIPYI